MASFLDGLFCGDRIHHRGAQPPSAAFGEVAGICNAPIPLRIDYNSLSLAMRQLSTISSTDDDEVLRTPMRAFSFYRLSFPRAPDQRGGTSFLASLRPRLPTLTELDHRIPAAAKSTSAWQTMEHKLMRMP